MPTTAAVEAKTHQKRPRRAPVHYPRSIMLRLSEEMAEALEREADKAEISVAHAAWSAIEAGLPRLKDRQRKARKRARTGAAE